MNSDEMDIRSLQSNVSSVPTLVESFRTHGKRISRAEKNRRKYRNFRKIRTLDTFDPSMNQRMRYLRGRSKVVELVVAEGLVIALTQHGLCRVFDRRTKRAIFTLNATDDEIVRSIFHCKMKRAIVLVSVRREDHFRTLRCEYVFLCDIPGDGETATITKRTPLFPGEALRWPGFVEFDDVNSKIMTHDARQSVYTMWSMTTFEPQFKIRDPSIDEVKVSPSVILVIFVMNTRRRRLPLQLRHIEDGRVLVTFEFCPDIQWGRIEFIEQFNEMLLVKQHGGPLNIIDVRNFDRPPVTIPVHEFATPRAFIYLYENRYFLTFRGCRVTAWDFHGRRVTDFEDHVLTNCSTNTNSVYITSAQDEIVSFCQSRAEETVGSAGSIHISNVLTGRCVKRIAPNAREPDLTHALTDITVLFYCEESNEIYTGNRQGFIHVWSN